MTEFDASAILAELKGFQRDAVEHVIERFYRDEGGSGRFLIADETGLGKSVIARGIIARTIEELQYDAGIRRIDVVYVCSNADLASQNLRRLNVTGNQHIGITSRLTLLARESRRLANAQRVGGKHGKKVNLVSFTPGTSFDVKGWRAGSKEERAMLHLMLQEIAPGDEIDERASRVLLQATVRSEASFQRVIDDMRASTGGRLDPGIRRAFAKSIRSSGLLREFRKLRRACRELHAVPESIPTSTHHDLIAKLRATLAKAGVETLEPDLIILDEFQRFRHLLDESSGEAAELAHALFNFSDAKVLLLSATPYKPFTNAESDGDESHYEDFMATLGFLTNDVGALAEIRRGFREYREAIVESGDADAAAKRLRGLLTPYITRSERPQLEEGFDLLPRWLGSAVPSLDDVIGFAGLERLGRALDAPIGLEYWKSIPYFANFMEGYQSGRRARELLTSDPAVGAALEAMPSLEPSAIEAFEELDVGNSHLRALAAETLDAGWWKLLWMPPSMPYLEPGPVFGSVRSAAITKRVVFSAWASVPTAVASLLSYEAERRMIEGTGLLKANTAEARRAVSARFNYVNRESGPAGMSTLALFWPHPALAVAGDPLAVARRLGRRAAEREITDTVSSSLDTSELPPAEYAWQAYFTAPDALPDGISRAIEIAAALETRGGAVDDEAESDDSVRKGLPAHVELALQTMDEPRTSHDRLAQLAAHAPGNIAWRALGRIRTEGDATTDAGQWRAAARLANGVRSMFNRIEPMLLMDRLYGGSEVFWHVVLDYCADGNLQSVLDEYVFQLRSESTGNPVDDALLESIAARAAEALTLRPSRYQAQDPRRQLAPIPFTARFALRYGGRTDAADGGARQPEIRNAFNSPFWPFVLASTSVGQEGIDFHWWSHSVVHWNLPSNPVDFEQREGRVNRFAGHAVRKNVADAHWEHVLASEHSNPWATAFDAAIGAQSELGEFAPWWIYRGPARIERTLVSFPLSRDRAKYERLRTDLTLYRLTLGQPRQEDMVEILRRRGVEGGKVQMLDLRPPTRRPGTT